MNIKTLSLKTKIYVFTTAMIVLFLILQASLVTGVTLLGTSALKEITIFGLIGTLCVVALMVYGTYYLNVLIVRPLLHLRDITKIISEGGINARVSIASNNELGEIGININALLDGRVASLIDLEQENDQLNDSIVLLLESVAQLAQKNLTVKAAVKEDITGPLADALNMMTYETSEVLSGVTRISKEVAKASNLIKEKSDAVLTLASIENHEVELASSELEAATESIKQIEKLADASNISAEAAIETTITAMSSVTDTVISINAIRDTLHETEKRIKRLGERSQEISTAVSLIKNISERTHILALNASMHAASAGEAGRGFAVVADEVKRLAENAKDSTSQITTLVNNIQVETSGAVDTMNNLISQVVSGTKLAETAGEQMNKTQSTTAELVDIVKEISERASHQSKISEELSRRTQRIRESVSNTGQELKEQAIQTDSLVRHAGNLVDSVAVFTLPEAEAI